MELLVRVQIPLSPHFGGLNMSTCENCGHPSHCDYVCEHKNENGLLDCDCDDCFCEECMEESEE